MDLVLFVLAFLFLIFRTTGIGIALAVVAILYVIFDTAIKIANKR